MFTCGFTYKHFCVRKRDPGARRRNTKYLLVAISAMWGTTTVYWCLALTDISVEYSALSSVISTARPWSQAVLSCVEGEPCSESMQTVRLPTPASIHYGKRVCAGNVALSVNVSLII